MKQRAPSKPQRNDLELYGRHAEEWWCDGESRAFCSLRAVNEHHLTVVREHLGARIQAAKIADLGCGGGLLTIPLAEAGGRMLGLDRCGASLAEARREARRRRLGIRFVEGDVGATGLPTDHFDFVVLSDVVEHLERPGPALAESARILRPGGGLYVSTLSRTWLGTLLGVHVAEGLGYVPRGTHDPRLFLTPEQLKELARPHDLRLQRLCGEAVDLWRTLRSGAIHMKPSRSCAVSYGAFFIHHPTAS